jgi:hypothetical protein
MSLHSPTVLVMPVSRPHAVAIPRGRHTDWGNGTGPADHQQGFAGWLEEAGG